MDATNIEDAIHHQIVMGGPKEEEANYASGGYREGYRGNYYGRNSSNWRDRHENQNSTPGEENPPIPRLPE
ncbi:hypothetical protein Tco_0498131, partial [Tanacetum coccineum]